MDTSNRCNCVEVPRALEALGASLLYLPAFLIVEVKPTRPEKVILLAALLLVMHEGAHALALSLLTRELPKLGLGPLHIYVSSKRPVTRNQYLVTAVSPLGLSLILQLLYRMTGDVSFSLLYFMNLMASSGDFILAVESLAFPKDTLVKDTGLICFCPERPLEPPLWLMKFRPFLVRVAVVVPPMLLIAFVTIHLFPEMSSVAIALYLLGISLAFLSSG